MPFFSLHVDFHPYAGPLKSEVVFKSFFFTLDSNYVLKFLEELRHHSPFAVAMKCKDDKKTWDEVLFQHKSFSSDWSEYHLLLRVGLK